MKIELKKITYSARLSEETSAFAADIWIDGRRAGEVRNDGQGGSNRYHPWEIEGQINAYALTLPPLRTGFKDLDHPTGFWHLKQTADTLINDILQRHLITRDFRRGISKRVLFTRDGKVYETKTMPSEALRQLLASPERLATLKADAILNLLPETEALAMYMGGADE